MKRSGSSVPQFVQRIPADVRSRAIGRTLDIPLGSGGTQRVRITERMEAVRCSLRTRDPSEVKLRQAAAAAYLERIWHALRRDRPVMLSKRDAHALAGELYHAWADGQRESDLAATHDPATGKWTIEYPNQLPDEEERVAFAKQPSVSRKLRRKMMAALLLRSPLARLLTGCCCVKGSLLLTLSAARFCSMRSAWHCRTPLRTASAMLRVTSRLTQRLPGFLSGVVAVMVEK